MAAHSIFDLEQRGAASRPGAEECSANSEQTAAHNPAAHSPAVHKNSARLPYLNPNRNPDRQFRASFAASLALHCAAILALIPSAIFITHTQQIARGDRGLSSDLVYLAPPPVISNSAPNPRALLQDAKPVLTAPRLRAQSSSRPAQPKLRLEARKNRDREPRPEQPTTTRSPLDSVNANALAGVDYGSALDGSEHDIRPALPVVFPDPPVIRAPLPPGVEGDVIVEVTIDARGNVVQTRLLTGMGYGVVPVIITTLQSWRFKPATRDGVPIASKQDVHFHLPS